MSILVDCSTDRSYVEHIRMFMRVCVYVLYVYEKDNHIKENILVIELLNSTLSSYFKVITDFLHKITVSYVCKNRCYMCVRGC